MHLSGSFPASSDSAPPWCRASLSSSTCHCPSRSIISPGVLCLHQRDVSACSSLGSPGSSQSRLPCSFTQHPLPASSTRGHRSGMSCCCCLQVSPYPFKHGHDSVSPLRLGHNTDVGTPGLMPVSSVGRGRSWHCGAGCLCAVSRDVVQAGEAAGNALSHALQP